MNAVAAVWMLPASIFMLAAVTLQSLTAIIACATASACSAAVAATAAYAPEKVGVKSTPAKRAPRKRAPGKSAAARPVQRPAGAANPRGAKPAASTARPAGSKVPCGCRAGDRCPGAGKCQCAKCKSRRTAKSAKPARKRTNADVPRWSPGDDGSHAWLRSPEAKRIERRIVREERRRQQ